MFGTVECYSVIKEIIEFAYYILMKYVLFICDWFYVNNCSTGLRLMSMASLLLILTDFYPRMNLKYSVHKFNRCFDIINNH